LGDPRNLPMDAFGVQENQNQLISITELYTCLRRE
jgi:hypothetical protein